MRVCPAVLPTSEDALQFTALPVAVTCRRVWVRGASPTSSHEPPPQPCRVGDKPDGWVTFHTFRRSVATLIDREVGLEAAQAQLRHDDSDITRDFYVHEATVAPDLTPYLEKFWPAT